MLPKIIYIYLKDFAPTGTDSQLITFVLNYLSNELQQVLSSHLTYFSASKIFHGNCEAKI